MSLIEKEPSSGKLIGCSLRLMEARDVRAVAEIDREAFPTTWPPPPFQRELHNRQARYLVVRQDPEGVAAEPSPSVEVVSAEPSGQPKIQRFLDMIRRGLLSGSGAEIGPIEFILGFVGIWFIDGNAHITAIAAREAHRGRGIGELLLIGAVEMALLQELLSLTLEVRVSNTVAQSLYRKYGFQEVGVRKRYYRDNNEDALIMSTDPIETPEYQLRFQKLVAEHERRWGHASRILA